MYLYKNLKEIFKDYPYIVSAYLFGSQSSGVFGPMSDVDIAMLLNDNAPKGRELIHEQDYLSYRISKALGVKEVDIVVLNNQGPIFQHNILRTGKLIYDSAPLLRIKFTMRVISTFCDFEPTLRFIEKFHFRGQMRRCASL